MACTLLAGATAQNTAQMDATADATFLVYSQFQYPRHWAHTRIGVKEHDIFQDWKSLAEEAGHDIFINTQRSQQLSTSVDQVYQTWMKKKAAKDKVGKKSQTIEWVLQQIQTAQQLQPHLLIQLQNSNTQQRTQ